MSSNALLIASLFHYLELFSCYMHSCFWFLDRPLEKQWVLSSSWSVRAKFLQSCPTLWDPVDCSPPGSSVCGISQARILEWVTTSSRRSSWPRDQTCNSYVSSIGRQVLYHFFTTSATWEDWLKQLSPKIKDKFWFSVCFFSKNLKIKQRNCKSLSKLCMPLPPPPQ